MKRSFPGKKPASWLALLALLTINLLPCARATDWIYRVRPTDNIWNLSQRYLKPGMTWQQLRAYNKVTDPYHLPPGMTLHVPIAWLLVQPAQAKVVAVIGGAHALLPGHSQPETIRAGMSFAMGAHLSTDPSASLTLEFADGSRVLLQGDSVLDLDRLSAYGRTGMVDTRLRLQHGRVTNDVTHIDGAAHFSVQTPGSISSVRGTHFRVATDGGHAQTEVLGGRVDVDAQHRHVMVNTGKGVVVADGQHPGRVQALLAAPALQCPQRPVHRVGYAFRWTALAGATHYRAQVAPDMRFEALLLDRVVDTTGVNLPDLPDGDYAIRLHGIDTQRLEGKDASCAIHIDAHPQPPLIVTPQPGSKVREVRPQFRWTKSMEAASYAWQLASDADFNHLLGEQPMLGGDGVSAPQALPPGRYWWRIASRDRHGKLGPYSDAFPFDRVVDLPAPKIDTPKHAGKQMHFGWQAGLPGQHYRVQLAHDTGFAHPLVDETVAQPSVQISKPGHGVWYLRVRSIDTDGYAGPWSPVQEVKLPCFACRIAAAGGGAAVLWLLL